VLAEASTLNQRESLHTHCTHSTQSGRECLEAIGVWRDKTCVDIQKTDKTVGGVPQVVDRQENVKWLPSWLDFRSHPLAAKGGGGQGHAPGGIAAIYNPPLDVSGKADARLPQFTCFTCLTSTNTDT
jgi:hypothetical protein